MADWLDNSIEKNLNDELHRVYLSKFRFPYILVDDLNGLFRPVFKLFKPPSNWQAPAVSSSSLSSSSNGNDNIHHSFS